MLCTTARPERKIVFPSSQFVSREKVSILEENVKRGRRMNNISKNSVGSPHSGSQSQSLSFYLQAVQGHPSWRRRGAQLLSEDAWRFINTISTKGGNVPHYVSGLSGDRINRK